LFPVCPQPLSFLLSLFFFSPTLHTFAFFGAEGSAFLSFPAFWTPQLAAKIPRGA
jgi:hypothetical protein